MALTQLSKEQLSLLQVLALRLKCQEPEMFVRTFFPSVFNKPSCRFHKDIYELTKKEFHQEFEKFVAPREHGKSKTVTFAMTMYKICYEQEPFILLFSETAGQANDFLQDIKDEIDNNKFLTTVFPDIKPLMSNRGIEVRYRQNEIILKNRCIIISRGAGSSIRGIVRGKQRPTLIILDDIEGKHVDEPLQRKKLMRWYKRVIRFLGMRASIIMVGNYIHHDCFLYNVGTEKGSKFKTHVYKAIEKDEKGNDRPLWKENYSLKSLYELRAEDLDAFEVELQNNPMVDKDIVFEIDFDKCYYRKEDININALNVLSFFDPSMGKSEKSDFAAITTIGYNNLNQYYVLGYLALKEPPAKLIPLLIDHLKKHKSKVLGVESNAMQELYADQIKEAMRKFGYTIPIEKVISSSDKELRIKSIAPIVNEGKCKMPTEWRDQEKNEFMHQIRFFPQAGYDDIPDTLEGCISLSKKYNLSGKFYKGEDQYNFDMINKDKIYTGEILDFNG